MHSHAQVSAQTELTLSKTINGEIAEERTEKRLLYCGVDVEMNLAEAKIKIPEC